MSIHYIIPLIFLSVIFSSCSQEMAENIRYREKKPAADLYDMTYENGNWSYPDYKDPFVSFGNHRIILEVDDTITGPVLVIIPWRRPDTNPAGKAVIIVDAENGELVNSKMVKEVNSEFGHFAFEPLEGSSRYYVYYLPHRSTGGYYPKLTYIRPGEGPDTGNQLAISNEQLAKLPFARILSAQSIDDFHSFFPMEVIATESEVNKFIIDNPASYYLFPEYREHTIKMNHHLPQHWVSGILVNGLQDTVQMGTYYAFQVGVWSPEHELKNMSVNFSDLVSKNDVVPATAMTCFNFGGTDLNGHPFIKRLDINRNRVQALWCGIEIPTDIKTGEYLGKVIIQPEGKQADTVFINLQITAHKTQSQGDDNSMNMSRLRWLNSTIGTDSDFIAKPFIPVNVQGSTIHILGRELELDPLGFPSAIYSYFTQEMTSLSSHKDILLAAPIRPELILSGNHPVIWTPEEYSISQDSPGMASWSTTNSSGSLNMKVDATIEYDGMLEYSISLIAHENIELQDFILHLPMRKEAAEFMLGLGHKGGKRPDHVDWRWDVVNNHHEGAWLGTVNKGIQYVLRDENYERPLNTNFYRQKPLNAPPSWYNEGKGGIRIRETRDYVAVENYSGSRSMMAGDTLHFNVRFLITPFKLIDTKTHFNTRFVHKYVPVDSVVAWSGTIVNVHHANEINPYINYPFYNIELQKAYIDEAHSKGIKVKLYNTIRELTYKAYELFAFRSLGYEILNDGEGGGHSWLQEHLRNHYHSAWHATSVNDAAILNKGNSRWTNYYIEGVNWLAEQQQIDGLYLDDIAFSRNTVKRLANVLHQHRSEVVIDLHSANQFNERDGYINSAFLYMEHMPYITRLWFGEYFEYDLGPDYWLTEVSGIPFGLTGEMLEGGGHPWRGLVYGMTSRIYGDVDPRPIWKLFDDFKIADSEMLGYWVERSPIKTYVENIRSTVYIHNDHVLIAIGSWSEKDELVPLNIDWTALGMDKNKVRLYSPEIDDLQKKAEFEVDQPLSVKQGQGKVLILEKVKEAELLNDK
jgi:hypothetical protein